MWNQQIPYQYSNKMLNFFSLAFIVDSEISTMCEVIKFSSRATDQYFFFGLKNSHYIVIYPLGLTYYVDLNHLRNFPKYLYNTYTTFYTDFIYSYIIIFLIQYLVKTKTVHQISPLMSIIVKKKKKIWNNMRDAAIKKLH